MAINYPMISAEQLFPISGIQLGCAQAGIRYQHRDDVVLITIDSGASVSGVFTENVYCAAPVILCRKHLKLCASRYSVDQNMHCISCEDKNTIRAFIINSGNANAGTGQQGLLAATKTCMSAANLLNIRPEQVLPFSTGVILEPLPVDKLVDALPYAIANCRENNWFRAAQAIMTTDTKCKAVSRQCTIDGVTISVTGIAKGAGMICPNMATMLGFIATDASIEQHVLDELVKNISEKSFNSITVDGDTSTNDSFMLIATGKSDLSHIDSVQHKNYKKLAAILEDVAIQLATMIIRDAEGATKFITIRVSGAETIKDCKTVAYAIANSPLVKTAFYASDANLGRILAAIGRSGIPVLNIKQVKFYLNDLLVVENGCRHDNYSDEAGKLEMEKSEIVWDISIGSGPSQATIWTCDLSHEYVSINADYRS